MGEFSYNKLRDLQREERDGAALVKLPDDFYLKINELVKQSRETASKSRSISEIREYENTLKVVREIFHSREQKIAFRALRAKGGSHDSSGMTREEHELYDRLISLFSSGRQRLDSVFEPSEQPIVPAAVPKAPEKTDGTFKKVKFLKDIPAYRGSDQSTYGPFKLGEECAMPLPEADWLVRGKMADLIS